MTAPVAAHEVHERAPVVPVQEPAQDRPELALMGTIPIYWGETEDAFDALITGDLEPHWARARLEQDFALAPLDFLSGEALAPHTILMMAQPRGLAGEENVALDNWVRAGGQLLLFADPAMTGHSHYNFGDKRRPQDTALLSPILARWGLELRFDAEQAEGLQNRNNDGGYFPVNLPGEFALTGDAPPCTLSSQALLAECTIEDGVALIVADAAMLDNDGPWPGAVEALADLVAHLDLIASYARVAEVTDK